MTSKGGPIKGKGKEKVKGHHYRDGPRAPEPCHISGDIFVCRSKAGLDATQGYCINAECPRTKEQRARDAQAAAAIAAGAAGAPPEPAAAAVGAAGSPPGPAAGAAGAAGAPIVFEEIQPCFGGEDAAVSPAGAATIRRQMPTGLTRMCPCRRRMRSPLPRPG